MSQVRLITCTAMILLATFTSADAAEPTADEVVTKMLDAVGGEEAFRQLGLLEMRIGDVETTADGNSQSSTSTAYLSTTNLESLRLEMPGDIIVVRSGDGGWAQVRGKLDERPQASAMARGTVHQRIVPFLLPYSLTVSGVRIKKVIETDFDGVPAWRLHLTFDRNFFASPVMNTQWAVYVARADAKVLAAEFRPTQEFQQVQNEGVRYKYTKSTTIDGVTMPAQVVMLGVFANGLESGHNRIVNITTKKRDWDATLFVDPEKLSQFDEADPLSADPE